MANWAIYQLSERCRWFYLALKKLWVQGSLHRGMSVLQVFASYKIIYDYNDFNLLQHLCASYRGIKYFPKPFLNRIALKLLNKLRNG